jgi:Fe-S cluster assembly protein SufD
MASPASPTFARLIPSQDPWDDTMSRTSEPTWLRERRERAAGHELALPDQKQKGWEFTDLSSLDLASYAPAGAGDPSVATNAARVLIPVDGGSELLQVDGSPSSDFDAPATNGRPTAPAVLPLDAAAERFADLVGERFGTLVSPEDPFVALNEAGWSGGALVYVPAGARLESPVTLTAVQNEAGRMLNWRTLIILEEGAEAEVWEQYVPAAGGGAGMFNGVTEIVVGPGASLRYVCGQSLNEQSWVFASQRAELERDGSLDWVALGFGSARGKVRMETKLAGRGSSAKVTGAYAGRGRQHLDYDTRQEHAAEDTTSDLAFRGVLGDRATAVWRGMIRVDPGAQRTDAFQDCRNLLISPKAHADAIPGLEIEADDVRCTHAAAVAQLDAEQLYYLTARGIDATTAKTLLIEGFLGELVARVPAGATQDALSGALENRLAQMLSD